MDPRVIAPLIITGTLILSGCSALAAPPVPPKPQYPQTPQVTSSQTLTLTAPAWVTQKIRDPDLKRIAEAVTVMYHLPRKRANSLMPLQQNKLPFTGHYYQKMWQQPITWQLIELLLIMTFVAHPSLISVPQ